MMEDVVLSLVDKVKSLESEVEELKKSRALHVCSIINRSKRIEQFLRSEVQRIGQAVAQARSLL